MAGGVVCFTGHRNKYFSFGFNEADVACVSLQKAICDEIENLITTEGAYRFITGMAQGVDFWCAEAVLDLQKIYPQIKLFAALPCGDQSAKWSKKQQSRWKAILNRCERVHVLREHYTRDCMMARNKFMVNNSDYVLAVYSDKRRSGTGATISYAREQGRKISIIDPEIHSLLRENF